MALPPKVQHKSKSMINCRHHVILIIHTEQKPVMKSAVFPALYIQFRTTETKVQCDFLFARALVEESVAPPVKSGRLVTHEFALRLRCRENQYNIQYTINTVDTISRLKRPEPEADHSASTIDEVKNE
jgi:hypothetical protein